LANQQILEGYPFLTKLEESLFKKKVGQLLERFGANKIGAFETFDKFFWA